MPAIGRGTPEQDIAAIEALEREQRERARPPRSQLPNPTRRQRRSGDIEPDRVRRPASVPHGWMKGGF